jgi:hypothetical protein
VPSADGSYAPVSQKSNWQHADAVSAIPARPVIMPFFFYGPSNEIHQAKEAVYAMQNDTSEPVEKDEDAPAFTLMLPHLLPHYSQSKVDGPVAFSEYFDIVSNAIIEERDLFGDVAIANKNLTSPLDGFRMRTVKPTRMNKRRRIARVSTAQIPDECLVYHQWNVASVPLKRCSKQAEWFRDRRGGRPCKKFTFVPFRGRLRDLAATMRANGTTFALSCYLEPAMGVQSTQRVNEHVQSNDSEADVDRSLERWLDTAKTLTLKLTSAPKRPTLTLHLRAPDPVVLRKNRSLSDDFVIGKDAKKHAIVRGRNMTQLIQGCIQHMEKERRLQIRAIHIMTNDPLLADFLRANFQARGYSVTFSRTDPLQHSCAIIRLPRKVSHSSVCESRPSRQTSSTQDWFCLAVTVCPTIDFGKTLFPGQSNAFNESLNGWPCWTLSQHTERGRTFNACLPRSRGRATTHMHRAAWDTAPYTEKFEKKN